MTQDSIGDLKTLCMSILSLAVAFESELKRYSSSESDKKTQAFEYEFGLYLTYAPTYRWQKHYNYQTFYIFNIFYNIKLTPILIILIQLVLKSSTLFLQSLLYCNL